MKKAHHIFPDPNVVYKHCQDTEHRYTHSLNFKQRYSRSSLHIIYSNSVFQHSKSVSGLLFSLITSLGKLWKSLKRQLIWVLFHNSSLTLPLICIASIVVYVALVVFNVEIIIDNICKKKFQIKAHYCISLAHKLWHSYI